ncbi:MAG: TolC family protein [Polyangiaceae bacterium]
MVSIETASRFFLACWVSVCAGCVSAATSTAREAATRELARGTLESTAAAPEAKAAPRTCEELADRISSAHPAPLVEAAEGRAALERSRSEAAIPGPRVRFEIWDFPIGDPATADEDGMYMVGISQEIPPLAARDKRALAAAEEARARAAKARSTGLSIWEQAATLCVDWVIADRTAGRLREYASHLGQVREGVLAIYSGGGAGGLAGIARADTEAARAERRAIDAEQTALVSRETLVALAGPDVPISEHPPELSSCPDATSLGAWLEDALANRPDLAAANAEYRAAAAEADAASADAQIPEFEVSLTYMQTPNQRAGLGAGVMMSIPWLGGGGAASRAAAETASARKLEISAAEREATVELRRAVATLAAAQATLRAIVERELPAAERASQVGREALLGGNFDLADWLLAAHEELEARVDREEAVGRVAQAWIELQFATGRKDAPADEKGGGHD